MPELEPAPSTPPSTDMASWGRWMLWYRKLYDFLAKPTFPKLPEYADNAAALAGGLVAGDMYRTATGEARIVV